MLILVLLSFLAIPFKTTKKPEIIRQGGFVGTYEPTFRHSLFGRRNFSLIYLQQTIKGVLKSQGLILACHSLRKTRRRREGYHIFALLTGYITALPSLSYHKDFTPLYERILSSFVRRMAFSSRADATMI